MTAMAKKPKSMQEQADYVLQRRAEERLGGGEARLQKQHDKGVLTARERIDALLDPDTFQEVGLFRRNRTVTFGMDKANMPADGVVTGTGAVFGRPSTSPARTSRSSAARRARRTARRSSR
jgi:methylmalonyl-CoA carboxyltransferase large subunit